MNRNDLLNDFLDQMEPPYPTKDRRNLPLVTVEELKAEIAKQHLKGKQICYRAFVSGPAMNLEVEIINYDAKTDKARVSNALIQLIRRGADRIVITGEVNIYIPGRGPADGAIIIEATEKSEVLHFAKFDGAEVGEWEIPPQLGGNLAFLFEKAKIDSAPDELDIRRTLLWNNPDGSLAGKACFVILDSQEPNLFHDGEDDPANYYFVLFSSVERPIVRVAVPLDFPNSTDVMGIELSVKDGQLVKLVTSLKDTPFKDVALDPKQAEASQFLGMAMRVAEAVVEQDPDVRRHLNLPVPASIKQ